MLNVIEITEALAALIEANERTAAALRLHIENSLKVIEEIKVVQDRLTLIERNWE